MIVTSVLRDRRDCTIISIVAQNAVDAAFVSVVPCSQHCRILIVSTTECKCGNNPEVIYNYVLRGTLLQIGCRV